MVTAVIITFNRLALLKECIAAIKKQTLLPEHIIVINNNSTDGTEQWLLGEGLQFITQENLGASWGFYTGALEGYNNGSDWTWIMDDDTIPTPSALEELISRTALPGLNIGFLSSKATWTDGKPHRMNIQCINSFVNNEAFNAEDEHGIFAISSASFVSLLVSRPAISAAGLPMKEFFIWGDDIEFTERIIASGFRGYYVPGSIVLHKTALNHSTDIYNEGVENIWKYRYGLRNQLFMVRRKKGNAKFWLQLLKRFFIWPFRIMIKRKDHRWTFIKLVWGSSFAAINFRPSIKKLS